MTIENGKTNSIESNPANEILAYLERAKSNESPYVQNRLAEEIKKLETLANGKTNQITFVLKGEEINLNNPETAKAILKEIAPTNEIIEEAKGVQESISKKIQAIEIESDSERKKTQKIIPPSISLVSKPDRSLEESNNLINHTYLNSCLKIDKISGKISVKRRSKKEIQYLNSLILEDFIDRQDQINFTAAQHGIPYNPKFKPHPIKRKNIISRGLNFTADKIGSGISFGIETTKKKITKSDSNNPKQPSKTSSKPNWFKRNLYSKPLNTITDISQRVSSEDPYAILKIVAPEHKNELTNQSIFTKQNNLNETIISLKEVGHLAQEESYVDQVIDQAKNAETEDEAMQILISALDSFTSTEYLAIRIAYENIIKPELQKITEKLTSQEKTSYIGELLEKLNNDLENTIYIWANSLDNNELAIRLKKTTDYSNTMATKTTIFNVLEIASDAIPYIKYLTAPFTNFLIPAINSYKSGLPATERRKVMLLGALDTSLTYTLIAFELIPIIGPLITNIFGQVIISGIDFLINPNGKLYNKTVEYSKILKQVADNRALQLSESKNKQIKESKPQKLGAGDIAESATIIAGQPHLAPIAKAVTELAAEEIQKRRNK